MVEEVSRLEAHRLGELVEAILSSAYSLVPQKDSQTDDQPFSPDSRKMASTKKITSPCTLNETSMFRPLAKLKTGL